jgi:GNAT superfamily N-acetyltransferase
MIFTMIYRLATPADAEALAEMRWDFRIEENPAPTQHSKAEFMQTCADFLRAGLSDGSWHCWVAEDEGVGQLVSHIFIFAVPKIPKPNALHESFGYVTNVYTRPNYRNSGIGSQLMAHVVQWAKDGSSPNFEQLIVSPSERSVPYYQRAGFTPDTQWLQIEIRPYIL